MTAPAHDPPPSMRAVMFTPIDALKRSDADVTIWALRNDALFSNPVDDPFFKATTPDDTVKFHRMYKADNALTALGCSEQYAFCNSNNCSALTDLFTFSLGYVKDHLGFNNAQVAAFDFVWKAFYAATAVGIATLGSDLSEILLAKRALLGPTAFSTDLLKNHWQEEVHHLFNISMATVQNVPIMGASPPKFQITLNSTYDMHVIPPNTTEKATLCKNQKIRTTGHYNFNFTALLIIIISGLFLVLLSYLIPAIVIWSQKRSATSAQFSCKEWEGNDVLQLHREALKSGGIGPWKTQNEVPILQTGRQKFNPIWLSSFPLLISPIAQSFLSTSNNDISLGYEGGCGSKDGSTVELLGIRGSDLRISHE